MNYLYSFPIKTDRLEWAYAVSMPRTKRKSDECAQGSGSFYPAYGLKLFFNLNYI